MRTGSALLATGAVASTAGCLRKLPFVGGFGYEQWLPAPGELEDEPDDYGFYYAQPKAILSKEDDLDEDFVDNIESEGTFHDATGIDADEVEHSLGFYRYSVNVASFNTDDVVEELEDKDFDEDTDHGGFTIYLNEEDGSQYRGSAMGIKGNTIVSTRANPDDAVDRLEDVIDAKTGDVDRYVDENDGMGALVGKLGTHHIVSGDAFDEIDGDQANPEAGLFDELVADGSTLQVKGENSTLRRVFTFPDNDAASDADVDDWVDELEDGSSIWSEAEGDISVNVKGESVVVSAEVESDELGT